MSSTRLLLFFALNAFIAGCALAGDILNREIAKLPARTEVRITYTDSAMDGGSILNRLVFSNGEKLTLCLDFPYDLATDKLLYPQLHFSVFREGQWDNREEIAHGTAAEGRLVELLDTLARTTSSPSERKNASSLSFFLKNRGQKFPFGRSKWWQRTRRTNNP